MPGPEFYRKLLENVSEYIYSVNYEKGEAVWTYHSPACEQITGYTLEEFSENRDLWYSMIYPDDRQRVSEFISQLLKDGIKKTIEHRIIHKDGSVRWVSNSPTVIKNGSGEVKYHNGFVQDITARKQSEEKLQKLIRAVEQSPATVVITDVQGNIEYVNPKFSEITGYDPPEVLGHNPRILKSGVQDDLFYKNMWDTIKRGDVWNGEFSNKKKNGDIYWEYASISPIKEADGTVTHFVAVKEDITERKAAVEALRISEETLRRRNETMEKDLKLAQRIQTALLPESLPSSSLVKTACRYIPFDRVGGDYYSFMELPDGSLAFFLGDVAGHGISSALFVSLLKSATERIFFKYGRNPATFLEKLNQALIKDMSSHFITAVYGIFRSTGSGTELTIANGGHPYPVIYRASGGKLYNIKSGGTVIGSFDNAVYEQKTVKLNPEDRIYIFTDGIPEAQNGDNNIIGFDDDLLELFKKSHNADPEVTLDNIISEIRTFAKGASLEDDIVLIGFEAKENVSSQKDVMAYI